ncbi:MAG TPA: Flp pilus assembly protein CpaB [Polyangiaceae bacterium]|jgi:pilus assembly protein CpaB
MKMRPAFIGLLAGIAGVVLLVLYMKRFEDDASGGRSVALLVAVSPISRGKPITDDMLGSREVPAKYADDRAIRASEREKITGLRATSTIPVQQTLMWTDVVAMSDDQRDLSSLVQPGNRAMPVHVVFQDEVPLIHPGDFVDVLAVFSEGHQSTVLLQRVLVLSIGQETSYDRSVDKARSSQKATMLTLSVSLQEAQLLALAIDRGKLTAVIRNPDDMKVAETPPDINTSIFQNQPQREAIQGPTRHRPIKLGEAK